MKTKTKHIICLLFIAVVITLPLPSYAFRASIQAPDEAIVGQEVSFEVKLPCNYKITKVKWSFGDSKKETTKGATTAHTYYDLGKLTVTAKVTAEITVKDKETGKPKTKPETDTAATQITIKAKLKLKASPDTIPADGKSTTDFTIYVVDYKNYVVNSYNDSIKLSSSNSEALSVPSSVSLSKGSATATGKAGTESGTVTVTGSGTYLKGNSCKVIVEGCKLDYIDAKDDNNGTRHSKTKLQMVSKNGAERKAIVFAHKNNKNLDWAEDEPSWSGLKEATGKDSVTVKTNKTGKETATAGGESDDVTIDIVNYVEHDFEIGTSAFGKFQDILNSVASKIGGDKDKIHASIKGGYKWYPVDQTESPNVNNTYEFWAGNGISYGQKVYIPALSINFAYVNIGVFAEPNLSLTLTGINITKDGSLSPSVKGVKRYSASGKATLSGSVAGGLGGEAHDPLHVISVKADLKAKVGASGSFTISSKHPTTLEGRYDIGKVTLSGMVEIKYRRKVKPLARKRVSTTPWQGMGDDVTIDLSGYFNKN